MAEIFLGRGHPRRVVRRLPKLEDRLVPLPQLFVGGPQIQVQHGTAGPVFNRSAHPNDRLVRAPVLQQHQAHDPFGMGISPLQRSRALQQFPRVLPAAGVQIQLGEVV